MWSRSSAFCVLVFVPNISLKLIIREYTEIASIGEGGEVPGRYCLNPHSAWRFPGCLPVSLSVFCWAKRKRWALTKALRPVTLTRHRDEESRWWRSRFLNLRGMHRNLLGALLAIETGEQVFMEITMRGLGATNLGPPCTQAQLNDPNWVTDPTGTQWYNFANPSQFCDAFAIGGGSSSGQGPDFGGIAVTGGTGPGGALPCCSGVQLGPLYANLASGDIRYRISDGKDMCDPNCLGVPPGGFPKATTTTTSMWLLIAGLGLVMLLAASR